ncbi:hypothetical protein KGQ71_03930 [Patescibacteria group bacterium]|nr:hypothetical protein [Patescibacteria group bacterium]
MNPLLLAPILYCVAGAFLLICLHLSFLSLSAGWQKKQPLFFFLAIVAAATGIVGYFAVFSFPYGWIGVGILVCLFLAALYDIPAWRRTLALDRSRVRPFFIISLLVLLVVPLVTFGRAYGSRALLIRTNQRQLERNLEIITGEENRLADTAGRIQKDPVFINIAKKQDPAALQAYLQKIQVSDQVSYADLNYNPDRSTPPAGTGVNLAADGTPQAYASRLIQDNGQVLGELTLGSALNRDFISRKLQTSDGAVAFSDRNGLLSSESTNPDLDQLIRSSDLLPVFRGAGSQPFTKTVTANHQLYLLTVLPITGSTLYIDRLAIFL